MENNNKKKKKCINILKNNKIDTSSNLGINDILTLKNTIMMASNDLQTAIQNNIEENFRTNYLQNNININTASAVSNGLSLVSAPTIIASLVLGNSHLCCIGGIGLLTSLCMDDGIDLYTSLHNRNTANSLDSVQQWISSQDKANVDNTSEQQNNNDNNREIKPINNNNNKNKDTITEAIKHLQQIMQLKYNNYNDKIVANNLVEDLFKVINSQLSK